MNIVAPGPEGFIRSKQEEFMVPAFKSVKTTKIALIDADTIKYKVVNAIAKDYKIKSAHIYADPIGIYAAQEISKIVSKFDAKGYIFCFSGGSQDTFRCSVAFDKKYKGTRTDEVAYPKANEDKYNVLKYIKERYPTLWYRELEADDILCMLQDEDTFIYSEDKDLRQVPGTHYDLSTGKFIEVSESEALKFLMTQMITGDTVDNISGLKSYGIVKADQLLTNSDDNSLVTTVLTEYIKVHGLTKGIDCFVESWNLLKLRLNRGDHFLSKYRMAFDTLEMIKNLK
jgi:5'-3' exonuclease